MKRKSVIQKTTVKRNKVRKPARQSRVSRLIRSFSFKFAVLLAALMAVSLFFIFLYHSLLSSPYVKLEMVVIKGVDEKTKDELLELSRLSPDMSLLAVNLNDLKKRLESHPWIRTVDLEKRFPHTLLIQAEKEKPRAIVVLDNLVYMNHFGSIFKDVGTEDSSDYPVITGISKKDHVMDQQLQLAANVLGILDSESGPWSPAKLSEMHVDKDGNVSLYSVSLPVVIKMQGTDFDLKKAKLKKIITHLKKTGLIHTVRAIDLDYKNGVVVSFKKG